jgi:hypothetical protein
MPSEVNLTMLINYNQSLKGICPGLGSGVTGIIGFVGGGSGIIALVGVSGITGFAGMTGSVINSFAIMHDL